MTSEAPPTDRISTEVLAHKLDCSTWRELRAFADEMRNNWRTEQEMHAAWRKRAMEAEAEIRSLRSPGGASGCQFCGGSQRVANNSPGAPDLPCPNCSAPEPSAELAPACCYAGQCDYKSPPIPRPAPEPRAEPDAWLIRFDDSDRGELMFTGSNAEAIARKTYAKNATTWTCRLFRCVAQSGYGPSPETKEAKP